MKTRSSIRAPVEPDAIDAQLVELEHLYQTAPVGLCLMDRNNRFVRINQVLAEINGKPIAAHIGKTPAEIIPDIAAKVEPFFRKVLENGEPILNFEIVAPAPARPGVRKYWNCSYYPLKGPDGTILGVSSVVQDITEFKRVEAALQEKEAQLRLMADSLPALIAYVDSEERYRFANAAYESQCRVPRGGNLGKTVREVVGRKRYEVLREKIRAALEGRMVSFDVEFDSPGHGEGKRDFQASYVPRRNEKGEVEGFYALYNEITDRKRIEESLIESEEKYRTLVEHAPDAIFVLDVESSRFVDVNRRAQDLLGMDRESLLNVGPAEVSPELQPDGRRSAEKARERVRHAVEKEPVTFEWTHRHADGRDIPCEVRLIRFPSKDRVLVRGSVADIGERKKRERELREHQESMRMLLESTNAIPWEGDATTCRFTYVGPRVVQMLGYPLERWFEKDFWPSHLHPEDRQIALDFCRNSSRKSSDFEFEYRMLASDGRVVWIHNFVNVEPDSGGAGKMRGFMVDVTGRKNAEEALRKSEERYAQATDSGRVGVWDWNLVTDEIFVDPVLKALLGYQDHEVGNRIQDWGRLVFPEDQEKVMSEVRAHLEGTVPRYEVEHRMVHKDGSIRWFLARGNAIRDPAGRAHRLTGTDTDITDRKRAELLQAGQKRVLEMLARGTDLKGVLEELTRTMEEQEPGLKCSILILDRSGRHLRHLAAPSLPGEYNRAIDGLAIGPKAGSCGTAAYRGEPVVVADTLRDPLWADYRDLARKFNLRACWSHPILSEVGNVLGTLALYRDRPYRPGGFELALVEQAAYLAGVAIERTRATTALRDSETALRVSQDQLRHLAGKLLTAQEEEKRRLARDLHDDLTQRLAVLAIESGELEKKMAGSPPALRKALKEIRQGIVKLSEDVHGMSRQLHPAIIEDLGLVDAVASECQRFGDREGVRVRFSHEAVARQLPRDVAICVYRVIQEGLRNVVKHSGARKAEVSMLSDNGNILIRIRDTGVGFDPAALKEGGKSGLGLASMEERVRLVEGRFSLKSGPGKGTTVEVRIPLKRSAE